MVKVVCQNSAGQPRWFHVNRHVVRELTDTGLVDNPEGYDADLAIASVLSESQIAKLISSKFPNIDDHECWSAIYRKLEANEHHVIPK